MANILQLPVAVSVTGDEYAWIVQGGSDKRTTLAAIAALANSGLVPNTRTIYTAGLSGLNGGGPLTTDLYLSLDVANLSPKTVPTVADSIAMNNAVDNTPVQVLPGDFYKTIAGLTHKVAPLSTDLLVVYSNGDSDSRYSTIGEALGAAGSVPPGGTTGQPLIKLSGVDYNTGFATLPVIGGGTGAITLTNHGVLLGQGTSAVVATSAMTDGQLLIGQTSADPAPTTVTGDVTISNLGVTVIGANKVTDAMLRQSAGLSVIGRSASTLGDVADIIGTADQVLRVAAAGASVGFGSIDLSKSAAVGSSILPVGNGGTNIASYTLGDTLYASGTSALSKLAGNTTAAIQYLSQTGTGSASAAPVWATISGGDITGAALTASNDTNVTLTLGGSPTTALLRASSITAGWTGQLSLSRGGTNANLTASNGGIFYSTASAGAILSGTATALQMLQSGASSAPAWSTATWPATTTINQILYSSAANTVAGLATANGGILNTSSSGVPSVTPTPVLGVAGTTVGTLGFQNATSGTITLSPVAGALGTVTLTLPAATDTVAVLAASQAFTNKTYNGLTITSTTGALTITSGKTLSVSNSLTLAGTDSTTMTFPGTSSTVLTTGNTALITKGYTVTPNNIGTVSSGTTTPDPANGNYQYYTNNGAHTLAAPSSDCAIDILITNGASAGSITFSGFTVGGSTGSALTTTSTNKFLVSIRRINSVATYSIYALQ